MDNQEHYEDFTDFTKLAELESCENSETEKELSGTEDSTDLTGSDLECCKEQTPNFSPHRNVINVFDAVIDEIRPNRGSTLVTITFQDCPTCHGPEQTVTLVVNQDTIIRNERGNSVKENDLREGMIINASFSATMTRSIPPQSQAYLIVIVRRPERKQITTGRIGEINGRNDSLLVISNHNPSSAIRFHITRDTIIQDSFGRRIPISRLRPGMRVRVEHASFMTASIPPQTTAFLIQIIR